MVDSLASGNRQAARFAVRVGCKAGRDAMPIPAGAASAASSSALVDEQNPAAGAAPSENLATTGSRGSPPPEPCLRRVAWSRSQRLSVETTCHPGTTMNYPATRTRTDAGARRTEINVGKEYSEARTD